MNSPSPIEGGDQESKQYTYHPACLLFPKLGHQELQELADDIKTNGLRNPIVMYQGQVLDGRNRLAACEIAGVEPRFVEWDGAGSPVEWVISENFVRRHLTSSQRAVIAHDLLPLLEAEAKERQRDGGSLAKKLAKHESNGKASQVAARIAKTNSNYVETVKTIGKQAPELLDQVRNGNITVPDAKKLSKLPEADRRGLLARCNDHPLGAGELHDLLNEVKKEQRQKAAREFAMQAPDEDNGIIVGDLGILQDQLKDGEANIFATDPPYADVDLYGRLAELAAAKLKPGGLCLAYAGQFYLPAVMAVMGKHLEYWWTLAIRFSGSHCAIHPRHIQSKWRSIVVFGKPPLAPAPQWLSDHLEGGGRDKEHHDWGQDQSEIEYLIEKLTEPGALVVEPFCGGGSVPAAAKKLGRRWIATEIDETTALIARKRLSEVTVGQVELERHAAGQDAGNGGIRKWTF